MKNYYALLGIESNATKMQIKKNYRTLANKFHPDKNSDPSSASKFIDITEAYDILSDKKKRAGYDLSIYEAAKQARESKETFTTVPRPRETLRTRRNKAQQKRSLKYHSATNKSSKLWYLVSESIYIFGRSVQHIIGASLIVVILYSAIDQLPDQLAFNWIMGIGVCLFIAGLAYVMFKLAQNFVIGIKKDVEAFSVFYRISMMQVIILTSVTFLMAMTAIVFVLNALRS